jgi:hypothetical protein
VPRILCGFVFSLLTVVLCAASEQDPRITLTAPEVERVRAGFADLTTIADDAFDCLTAKVESWNILTKELASQPDLGPDPIAPGELRALQETTDPAVAGAFGVVYGKFIERERLTGYPGWERWLIQAADAEDAGRLTDQVVILYVHRHRSAMLKPPADDWFVWAAAYFYKPLQQPSRTSDEPITYPAFVGAVFHTDARATGRPSDAIVWYALGLAVIFGVGITIVTIVSRRKSSTRPRPLAEAAARADEDPSNA